MAARMLPGAEVLIDPPLSSRGERFMLAMAAAAPAGSKVTAGYTGTRELLMLYGPGSPRKLPVVQQHLKNGGHVAAWDLGYWDREQAMRLSIDAMHPTAQQLGMAPEGQGRREFELREDADLAGPVVLVGLGPKSCYAYGLAAFQWERKALRDIQSRFPGRRVIWRPKGHTPTQFGRLETRHGMPIAEVLRGASLVVCRHSNVAIDACVAGVPVECDDGAAVALYFGNPFPTREQRADFLRRLSWWEWHKSEAVSAWAWIHKVIGCG